MKNHFVVIIKIMIHGVELNVIFIYTDYLFYLRYHNIQLKLYIRVKLYFNVFFKYKLHGFV